MLWYREFGFHNNPFSIKPAAFDNLVIGYDLSEIYKRIDKGKFIFLEGKYGYGKTTILKKIISKYRGQKDIAYYNCNRSEEEINVEALLKGRYGFVARMFGKMPKNMILLLDEVEKLAVEDQKALHKFHTQGNIQSVVFFGSKFENASFSTEMKKLMVNNVIQLIPLSDKEAVDLVRQRVGNLKLLPDKIIKTVFKNSESNPRIMLENLEDLCRYAVENSEEVVTEDHLNQVMKISETKPKKPKKKKQKKGKPTPVPEYKPSEESPDDADNGREEYFYY
jgi:replication-associated recombination protein RarA